MSAYGTYKIGTQTVTISGTIVGDVDATLTYHGGASLKTRKFPQSPLTKFVRSIRNAVPSTARATMTGTLEYGGIMQADWEVVCLETGSTATVTKTTTRLIHFSVYGSTTSFSDTRSEISDQALDGSFSLVIPCDICLEITQPQDGTGDLAPFWKRIEDTPPATDLEILLYPVPNTDITGTLIIAGRTLEVTVNTGANPGRLTYNIESTCVGDVFCDSHTPMSALAEADQTITVTNFLPLSTIAGLSSTSSVPQASAVASTASGVSSLQLSCSGLNIAADTSTAEGTAARSESGDRPVKMQSELYYMDSSKVVLANGDNLGGYTGAVSANIVGMGTSPIEFSAPYADPGTTPTTGRRFERAYTQKKCFNNVATQANDVTGFPSDSELNEYDDYSPVYADIIESSLTASGDDPDARRLLIRGSAFNVADFELVDSFNIDPCNDLTVTSGDYAGDWTISGSGSISIASVVLPGAITADIIRFSGAGETVTFTYDNPSYMANYRFLRLRVRADASSKVLTLTINGKDWDVTTHATANTWDYVFVDLCLPKNPTDTTDATDTRWPEDANGLPTEGVYFGIGSTTEFTLSGLESGVVYEIEDLTLSLNPAVKTVLGVTTPMRFTDLDLIQSLGYWKTEKPDVVVSEAGTTTEFFTSRFVYMRPDILGQSVDEPAFLKTVTTGGVSGIPVVTYYHRSIKDVIAKLNNKKYPGFTAIDLVPAPVGSGLIHPPAVSEYYNSDLPAVYLQGGGLSPAVVSDALRHPYFNVASNMEISDGGFVFQGIPLYDRILEWFPGCGNIFGISDYETVAGRLLLRAGSILRGASGHGLVADTSHVVKPDVTVTLYQATVSRGIGVSGNVDGDDPRYNTKGIYYTMAPYSQLGASTLETQDESISFTAYTRKRQRGVFIASLEGDVIAMACSATNRVVRALTSSGGVLSLEFLHWIGAGSGLWDRVTTSLTLTGAGALCYDTQGAEQRLWLAYEDTGTTIKSRYTDDEGGTWSVATTITSAGTYPAIAISPTSARHYFWVDGSTIKTTIQDSLSNTLTAATTIVGSGVASSAIDAVHDGTELLVTYKNGSGAVITVVSTDGGITFS